jgi:hypothetical protein
LPWREGDTASRRGATYPIARPGCGLVIRRASIRRLHVGELEIDHLLVRHLEVPEQE